MNISGAAFQSLAIIQGDVNWPQWRASRNSIQMELGPTIIKIGVSHQQLCDTTWDGTMTHLVHVHSGREIPLLSLFLRFLPFSPIKRVFLTIFCFFGIQM